MTEREAICEFHFHRGLKPANIKITPESKVKVLDFGLARVLAGKRSDIRSFGVVLYELLTRKHLFEGESISGTLAAVLRKVGAVGGGGCPGNCVGCPCARSLP